MKEKKFLIKNKNKTKYGNNGKKNIYKSVSGGREKEKKERKEKKGREGEREEVRTYFC